MLASRDDHFHQFVPSQRIPVIKEVDESCNNCVPLLRPAPITYISSDQAAISRFLLGKCEGYAEVHE